MAYPQVLGRNLIPTPAGPAFRSIKFTINDSVGQVTSPYTGQSQTQIWAGADLWTAECDLPPMKIDDASDWIAFLAACRGKANVFQLQDVSRLHPRGSRSGTPVVDGTHLASATTLNTRGWTANAQGVLKTADYITIGYRLHMVIGDVNADANGKAAIEIWPSLREALADAVSIITQGTTGLFQLDSNVRNYSVDEALIFGITFKAREAR